MNIRDLSPYIVGPVVREPDAFFGREDVITWVVDQLSNPNTSSVVLIGQRRTGKTSLLYQLRNQLQKQQYEATYSDMLLFPVYFDLQDQAKRKMGILLHNLAKTIYGDLEKTGINTSAIVEEEISEITTSPLLFQKTFLPKVYSLIQPQARLVLLLDEFDVLDGPTELELDTESSARAFFPFLRLLMEEDLRIASVIVLGRAIDDLTIDTKSMFKTSLQQEVWVLDRESTIKLIRQGERSGRLAFSESAIDRIIELTSGHAYFTQLICEQLWQRAKKGPLQVTAETVTDVAAPGLANVDHACAWIWEGLSPGEKICSSALAQLSTNKASIARSEVIGVLARYESRLSISGIESAPDDLVKRRVLLKREDSTYQFSVELFRYWISNHKPVEEVKNELDALDQIADNYYKIARNYYQARDLENARNDCQRALMRNPKHVGAHKLLGQILQAEGEIDNAIAELEAAYSLDRDAACMPLAACLHAKAAEDEEESQDEAALASYARILQILPDDQAAREGQSRILIKQGNVALAAGDFARAREMYGQAASGERLDALSQAISNAQVAQLSKEAQQLQEQQAWEKLQDIVEQILELDPTSQYAQDLQLEVAEELRLASLYAEAIGHMEQKAWPAALGVLSELVALRPTYRDAAYLLSSCVDSVKGSSSEALKRKSSPKRRTDAQSARSNTSKQETAVQDADPAILGTDSATLTIGHEAPSQTANKPQQSNLEQTGASLTRGDLIGIMFCVL